MIHFHPQPRRNSQTWLRLLFLLGIAFFLVACNRTTVTPLSGAFDRSRVEEAAQEVVDLLNERDQVGLENLSNPTMKTAMTDALYEQVFGILEDLGPYRKTNGMILQSTKSGTGSIAIVSVQGTYEKGEVLFTISFDEDMELAGLYLK